MSRGVPQPDPAVQRRGIRRLAVVGAVLCLPLVVSAWLVLPAAFDVVLLVLPFVYVAGVLVLGQSLTLVLGIALVMVVAASVGVTVFGQGTTMAVDDDAQPEA